MRTEIKELHQRLKTTSIYVTHDQIEAMTMADRIVVMRDGIVHQAIAPTTSRQRFRRRLHRFPAMNFQSGGRSGATCRSSSATAVVSARPKRGGRDGQLITYGVRPSILRARRTAVDVVGVS
jgi:multiple sugar transport system ATP-binding protein